MCYLYSYGLWPPAAPSRSANGCVMQVLLRMEIAQIFTGDFAKKPMSPNSSGILLYKDKIRSDQLIYLITVDPYLIYNRLIF